MKQSWFLWAILSACFAALTPVLGKIGIQGVNADAATFFRTVVIGIVLAGFLVVTGQWQAPTHFSGRTWLFLTLSGLATGASWVCYYRALQLGNASQVAPVDKLSVVLAALLAVAILGERPSHQDWLGIVLIASGVVVLAWRSTN